MENPELSRTLNQQITEIFSAAYPGEVRYRKCDEMIGRVKKGFAEISRIKLDGPDTPSNFNIGFVVGSENSNQRFEVTYFRYYSANTIERLTIVKNNLEKVSLRSRKYDDGRLDAYVEYFDDAPEFKRSISNHFETNSEMVEVIINDLVDRMQKLK